MAVDKKFWERAFGLAYYIHSDPRVARYVVVHGMELMALKAKQQDANTGANLMKLSGPQLFQIGLMEASAFYERRQERKQFGFAEDKSKDYDEPSLLELLIDLEFSESVAFNRAQPALTEDDLVIRYIKHLVQVTVSRNAYHVLVGISQFLYHHGLPQMDRIHESIDPERKRGGASGKSYKRARRRIWDETVKRFDKLLAVRGQGRFQPQERTLPLFALVNECLNHLALWDADCNKFTDEPHQAHALIHPPCYNRIIKWLRIKNPTANLIIPQFNLPANNNNNPPPDRRQPPGLTDEQLHLFQQICDKLGRRRKESEPVLLSVRVNDVERACFDPNAGETAACYLQAGDRIIEVYSREADGDLLLAACWLTEWEANARDHWTVQSHAEGGQVIRFDIAFVEDGAASVAVSYRETRPFRWLALEWRRLAYRLAAFQLEPATALAIGAILVGLITLSVFWLKHRASEVPEIVKQPSPVVAPSPTGSPLNEPPLLAENRDKPGNGNRGSIGQRNSTRRTRGLPLSSVARIYIQPFGEDQFGTALRDALLDRLKQLQLIGDQTPALADAILQQEPTSGKQPVRLRLVNKDGEVLWQASFKRLDAAEIAEKAVKNLAEAIESEKRKPQ